MPEFDRIQELKRVQSTADTLRKELGFAAPKEVIYLSSSPSDRTIIVEADGFGGATVLSVEGNYPIDFSANFEQSFSEEAVAIETAEKLAAGMAVIG